MGELKKFCESNAMNSSIKSDISNFCKNSADEIIMEVYCVVPIELHYGAKKFLKSYVIYYFGKIVGDKHYFALHVSFSAICLEKNIIVKKEEVFTISNTLSLFQAISTYPLYSIANVFLKDVHDLGKKNIIFIDYEVRSIILAMIQIICTKKIEVVILARTKEDFAFFSEISSVNGIHCEEIGEPINYKKYDKYDKIFVFSDKLDHVIEKYLNYFYGEIDFFYFSCEMKNDNNIYFEKILNKVNFKSNSKKSVEKQIQKSFYDIDEYINSGIYQSFTVKFHKKNDFDQSAVNNTVCDMHAVIIDNKVDFYTERVVTRVSDNEYGLNNKEGINLLEYILTHSMPCYFVSILADFFRSRSDTATMSDKFEQEISLPAYEDLHKCDQNLIEGAIKSIWCDTIGATHIDIDDDFFELGGDSLSAIHISYKIKVALNINIPVYAIIENPTLSKLYSYIKKALISISD